MENEPTTARAFVRRLRHADPGGMLAVVSRCHRDSCWLHHCRHAWPVRAVVGEPATDTSCFRTNSVSLVANNQGARDDIYAMVITERQKLVAKLGALDVAAAPAKTRDFIAISITPQ